MMQRALLLAGIILLGCGPKPEPATSPEAPPSAGSAASVSEAPAPSEPVVSDHPAPEAPPAAASPAAPAIRDVCYEMCDRLRAKCPQSAFESCRVNCTTYDSPPDGCDDVVRSALTCARDAADLVCANVAPESCAKPFRQITACAAGQRPAAGGEPATLTLPAGFVLFESAAEGVRAPMPEGAAAGEAGVVASAKHAGGAVYTIRKLPRPEGKANEKMFLKTGMTLLGRCSDKMKMQGMVDKPGRTSIHYTTRCPDGAVEHGVFWATDRALFVASVRGSGELGPADAFLYGFEAEPR